MRVNVAKSKVTISGSEDGTVLDAEIQEERMRRVNEFKYMRCMVNDRGKRRRWSVKAK